MFSIYDSINFTNHIQMLIPIHSRALIDFLFHSSLCIVHFLSIHNSSNQCFYTYNAQIQVTRCGAYFLHNSNPSIAYGCPTYGCSVPGRFHLQSVTIMPTFSLKVINKRAFKIIREKRKVSLMCVYRIATSNDSKSI